MSNNELKIDICIAQFELDTNRTITPPQLRGYIAYLFTSIPEFHHHSDNSYHYPLIQYKIVEEKLCVLGLQEYSNIVFEKISKIDHITIPDAKISINNLQIKKKIHTIEQKLTQYHFASPWIALNETNYEKYKQLDKSNKKRLLEKILVGNILSMFKGIGAFVTDKIEVSILKQFSKTILVHNNRFVGFSLDFASNTSLPEYLGLGKSVSKGFGVIERIK